MRSVSIALMFWYITFDVAGQLKTLHVEGRIVDTKHRPIPFASIILSGTALGTAADKEAIFAINVPFAHADKNLIISCIGYKSKKLPVSFFTNSPGKETVVLEEEVSLLREVEILEQAIKPIEIVTKAIETIDSNYPVTPFNAEFYSTLIASDPLLQNNYKLETILYGYFPSYVHNEMKKIEIRERRSSGKNILPPDYEFWPTLELHRADMISAPEKTGILNPKNLRHFILSYEGISLFEGDTVYQIHYFCEKPTSKITGYSIAPKGYEGDLFISTDRHAIIKHVYNTDQFSYTIIYRKHGNLYFPYLVNGERKTTGKASMGQIINNISLNRIVTDSVKPIIGKTNEFQHALLVKEDTVFWNNHYPKNTP